MRDVLFLQRMLYEKQFKNKVHIIYLILETTCSCHAQAAFHMERYI